MLPQPLAAPAMKYPIGCPHCRRIAGKPLAISTIADKASVQIALACGSCHHRWTQVVARADAT